MIYFIQAGNGGPIKIGYTYSALGQRISAIQTSCPFKIKLIGICTGDKFKENYLHRIFGHHNIRGEWFRPTREILDFIKTNSKNPKLINTSESKSIQNKSDYKKLPKNKYWYIPTDWWIQLEKYGVGGRARQCLMLIIAQTCGWNRKQAKISLNDFCRKTKQSKPSAIRALKALKNKKIINIKKISDQKYPAYSFNDNFNQWEVHRKKTWRR